MSEKCKKNAFSSLKDIMNQLDTSRGVEELREINNIKEINIQNYANIQSIVSSYIKKSHWGKLNFKEWTLSDSHFLFEIEIPRYETAKPVLKVDIPNFIIKYSIHIIKGVTKLELLYYWFDPLEFSSRTDKPYISDFFIKIINPNGLLFLKYDTRDIKETWKYIKKNYEKLKSEQSGFSSDVRVFVLKKLL